MRVITHCPACQTQFFATEEQLNKHGGKVRCGQCMHVFDANAQLVSVAANGSGYSSDSNIKLNDDTPSIDTTTPTQDFSPTETSINITEENSQQPSYLGDAFRKPRFGSKKLTAKSLSWLWAVACLILVLIAGIQSIYFLRDKIAIYYPNTKPLLVKACQQLACSINLPKQIESIIIDDSDMQEDSEHAGLIRFSSNLINTGSLILAYPNLELTLTDVDDKPLLRRIFKPNEYLSAETHITDGFKPGAEVKINLPISTNNVTVTGYRVFVTY
jgi:predicted Zn finger-like uncharacterized protein